MHLEEGPVFRAHCGDLKLVRVHFAKAFVALDMQALARFLKRLAVQNKHVRRGNAFSIRACQPERQPAALAADGIQPLPGMEVHAREEELGGNPRPVAVDVFKDGKHAVPVILVLHLQAKVIAPLLQVPAHGFRTQVFRRDALFRFNEGKEQLPGDACLLGIGNVRVKGVDALHELKHGLAAEHGAVFTLHAHAVADAVEQKVIQRVIILDKALHLAVEHPVQGRLRNK